MEGGAPATPEVATAPEDPGVELDALLGSSESDQNATTRARVLFAKAELARRIDRNASSIRRLFTASHARPELPLVAAIADALGAEVRVVARKRSAKVGSRAGSAAKRTRVGA